MNLEIWLPISAALIGLLSLATTPEAKGVRKAVLITFLVGLQIFLCVATIEAQAEKTKSDNTRINDLRGQVSDIKSIDTRLTKIAVQISETTLSTATKVGDIADGFHGLQQAQGVARGLGFTDTSASKATALQLETAFHAADLRNRTATSFESAQTGSDLTIQLFARNIDIGVVTGSLKKLGFKVIARPALVPGEPTNAIWYSGHTPPEAVKLVALTLISAGVEVKAIRPIPLEFVQKCKCNIQVGGDTEISAHAPLTLAQLQGSSLPLP